MLRLTLLRQRGFSPGAPNKNTKKLFHPSFFSPGGVLGFFSNKRTIETCFFFFFQDNLGGNASPTVETETNLGGNVSPMGETLMILN